MRMFLKAYDHPDTFDINEDSLNHSSDYAAKPYIALSPKPFDDLTPAELVLLRGATLVRMDHFAHKHTDGDLYLKSHSCNIILNGINWIPPDYTSKSIYIVRDPRDVVISVADHFAVDIDYAITIMGSEYHGLRRDQEAVFTPLMSWSMNVESWLRELPYDQLSLRYEDLIDDPEKWFQTTLNFLEITFDRSKFNDALKLTEFKALQKVEAAKGFEACSNKQERFFRQGTAGNWRDSLTPEQIYKIEQDHGKQMQVCGYELSTSAENVVDFPASVEN